MKLLILFTVFCYSVTALELPSYITACSKSSPDFTNCAKESAKTAIPALVNGDTKYHIPKLNPLTIDEIIIESNGQLKIQLHKAKVYGLSDGKLTDIKLDEKNGVLDISLDIDNLNIQSDYEINGRILVLPISGKGPANITAVGGHYNVKVNFDLIEKKGVKYLKLKDTDVKFDVKRAYFRLENLFDGNKELSDQMNKVLDDSWKDVLKDIGPAIAKAVGAIVEQLAMGVFERVPYDKFFLP
ncbi:circadian clock-controlled protein daywake-like [Chrysoperla carnea]|uniref:circadian clock-controlled protein daywake-like n=1 Tax=Chrysoperla carnea TaxID=189513 RepID=UPI001D06B558|nr:circadian clock-controlled protein daywake-like [Chrysoperla carnea]